MILRPKILEPLVGMSVPLGPVKFAQKNFMGNILVKNISGTWRSTKRPQLTNVSIVARFSRTAPECLSIPQHALHLLPLIRVLFWRVDGVGNSRDGWPGGGLHTKKNQTSIKIVEGQEEPNFYKNSWMCKKNQTSLKIVVVKKKPTSLKIVLILVITLMWE